MPHENIHGIDGEPGTESRVRVIWRPADAGVTAYDEPERGYVQVISEMPGSAARFPVENGTELAEGESPYERGEPCTGLAVTLNREGINRLIYKLRRARDQAFGADA